MIAGLIWGILVALFHRPDGRQRIPPVTARAASAVSATPAAAPSAAADNDNGGSGTPARPDAG